MKVEEGDKEMAKLQAEIERLGYLYDETERLKRALERARDHLVTIKSQVQRGVITKRTPIWLQRAIAEIDAAMGDELAQAYTAALAAEALDDPADREPIAEGDYHYYDIRGQG